MQHFIERIVSWWKTTMTKLKQRNWMAWAGVIGLFLVIQEVILTHFTGLAMGLGGAMLRGGIWFAGRPMWFGGVAILIYLTLLVTLSWKETRPPTRRPAQGLSADALQVATTEAAELRRKCDLLEAEVVEAHQRRLYGPRLIERPSTLSDKDVVHLQSQMEELRPILTEAVDALIALLTATADTMATSKGEDSAESILARKFVKPRVIVGLNRAIRLFNEVVEVRRDAREELAKVWRRFIRAQPWVAIMYDTILRRRPQELHQYARWEAANRRARDQMTAKLNHHQLKDVRDNWERPFRDDTDDYDPDY